jgi:hypothetical protein
MSIHEDNDGMPVPDFGEYKNRNLALKSIRVAMKN